MGSDMRGGLPGELEDRMAILRYERSIGRRAEESVLRTARPSEIAGYAARVRGWAPFSQEVADEAARPREVRSLATVRPDTPERLLRLGFADLPMHHTRAHLSIELSPVEPPCCGHGVGPEAMTALPELLEDPVAAYESPTRPGAVVLVLDALVGPGHDPFVACIDPDVAVRGTGIRSNFILSAYGRRQAAWEVGDSLVRGTSISVDRSRFDALLERRRAAQQPGRACPAPGSREIIMMAERARKDQAGSAPASPYAQVKRV